MKQKILLFVIIITANIWQFVQAQTVIQNWAILASDAKPRAITIDASRNVYIANYGNNTVSKITPSGIVTQAWASLVSGANPLAIAVDVLGNVYTANYGNNTISKITPSGIVTQAWAGLASADHPLAIAVDVLGNVYTASSINNTVSKITSSGIVTQAWASFGGGPSAPKGMAIDASGNVFTTHAAYPYGIVNKTTPSGIVTQAWATLPSTFPSYIAIDASGNVYTTYDNFDVVVKITPSGIITPIWATLGKYIAIDALSNVYATNSNGTVGKINASDGSIAWTTILASNAQPNAIAVDALGNVYIANYGNNTVSKIIPAPLPLILLSFSASLQNKNAQLQWQTANEINTSYFNIQRSTDGVNFITIGKTNAVGSGNNNYNYTDNILALNYPVIYYRLQNVDKDGSYTYSKVVSISLASNSSFSISPNPAKDVVFVSGNNLIEVKIIDNTGRVVMTKQLGNVNNASISIPGIAKGLYIVQMKDSKDNLKVEKLVIEK
jgi:DNA-binding beta-propeller fold protein YncE